MRSSKHENNKIHPTLGWLHMCLCKMWGWIIKCNSWELINIYLFLALLFCNFYRWTFRSNGNIYTTWTCSYKVNPWPWFPTWSFKSKFCKSPFPYKDSFPSSTCFTFTIGIWFEIFKFAPTFTKLFAYSSWFTFTIEIWSKIYRSAPTFLDPFYFLAKLY